MTETPLLGKLDAPSPIQTGCWDEDLYFIEQAIEGDGVGISHQSIEEKGNARKKVKERKRKGTLYPQNRRYNRGKHNVLNYFIWSVWG